MVTVSTPRQPDVIADTLVLRFLDGPDRIGWLLPVVPCLPVPGLGFTWVELAEVVNLELF